MGCSQATPFPRASLRRSTISHPLAQDFGAGGRSGRRREDVRWSRRRGVISPGSLPAALGARPSSVRSRFPGLWREARSPPRPFLALYLDAAIQSWDLTFLRLRRPRDPRQGALRASSGRGREDARSPRCWVSGWRSESAERDQADLAVISQRWRMVEELVS